MNTLCYEIRNLTKIYKGASAPANDGITMDIATGEIVGLLGPNGSGKTTLVRQMLGLLKPSAGAVRLFGRAVGGNASWVGRFVHYLPQNGLGPGFWHLTLEEAICCCAMLRGLSKADALYQARHWSERLGVADLRARILGRLSGGERRLAALAATLAGAPRALVADEPTNDLAPEMRRRVWEIFSELNCRNGLTIILVTHNVMEADKLVRRAAVMERGKLLVYEEAARLRRILQAPDLEGIYMAFQGVRRQEALP